jgi:hypothetical protein
MARKFIKDLRKGDLVNYYGAKLLCTEDARESSGHRPMAGRLQTAHGPSDCAVCRAVCVGGNETPGYLMLGKDWVFQGNLLAGRLEVSIAE